MRARLHRAFAVRVTLSPKEHHDLQTALRYIAEHGTAALTDGEKRALRRASLVVDRAEEVTR